MRERENSMRQEVGKNESRKDWVHKKWNEKKYMGLCGFEVMTQMKEK